MKPFFVFTLWKGVFCIMERTQEAMEIKRALHWLGAPGNLLKEEVAIFFFHFTDMYQLKAATEDQYVDYCDGIDYRIRLVKLINFGRAIQAEPISYSGVISSSQQVGNWLSDEMGQLTQEQLRIMCLNTKNEVISDEVIFKGDLNSCVAHPREIFQLAVRFSANKILMVHNHPSGQLTPSKNDLIFSKRLCDSGKMMGIDLLDSLIVSATGYLSLREEGILTES